MKKSLASLLCFAVFHASAPAYSAEGDINSIATETEDIYTTASGAQEAVYSSLSLSMLGWGVGLAAGIGVLASVLHQSTSSSSHDTCSHD